MKKFAIAVLAFVAPLSASAALIEVNYEIDLDAACYSADSCYTQDVFSDGSRLVSDGDKVKINLSFVGGKRLQVNDLDTGLWYMGWESLSLHLSTDSAIGSFDEMFVTNSSIGFLGLIGTYEPFRQDPQESFCCGSMGPVFYLGVNPGEFISFSGITVEFDVASVPTGSNYFEGPYFSFSADELMVVGPAQTVPEPHTALLIGLGFIGVAISLKRARV